MDRTISESSSKRQRKDSWDDEYDKGKVPYYYKMSSSCLNLFFPGGPIFSVLGSSRNDNASIQ